MSAEEIAAGTRPRAPDQLLDAEELAFLAALRRAGRMSDMDETELGRIADGLPTSDPDTRRAELLERYYGAGGDEAASSRRRRADRFFLQRMGDPATAASLVERLSALAPEIGPAHLERFGGTADGPLVLRAGEHFAAVLDEYEEETDTDQFDVSEAEARRADVPMVTVRGLVKALNVLLEKSRVRDRLVAIRTDLDREAYVALGLSDAMSLADKGFLDDERPEDVMDLAAW